MKVCKATKYNRQCNSSLFALHSLSCGMCIDVHVPVAILADSQRLSCVAHLCPGSDGRLLSLKGRLSGVQLV